MSLQQFVAKSVRLVFLHAFPLDERMWGSRDGVAPSLYGRGSRIDEWAAQLLDEVDGELALVGASMGGYCALAIARRAPQRVRGMLLVGSRPDADSPERRAGRAKTIALIREHGPHALWQDMRPKLFADPTRVDESLLHDDADDLVAAVEAIRDRPDSTDVARESNVVFVVGEHDPFVSAEELRDFDVREIAGCAHLPPLERPAEFESVLAEFLTRV
jgi:pimeloyl-ACP methyl ester carboxylesterase